MQPRGWYTPAHTILRASLAAVGTQPRSDLHIETDEYPLCCCKKGRPVHRCTCTGGGDQKNPGLACRMTHIDTDTQNTRPDGLRCVCMQTHCHQDAHMFSINIYDQNEHSGSNGCTTPRIGHGMLASAPIWHPVQQPPSLCSEHDLPRIQSVMQKQLIHQPHNVRMRMGNKRG